MMSDLPVLLRGAVLGLWAWIILQPQYPTLSTWLLVLESLAALFVISGFAGRIFATISLILLGIGQVFAPIILEQYLLAVLYTGLLFLGSGNYSLWKPEDPAVYRRAGTRHTSSDLEQKV
jgi:hypothetical protein